MAADGAGVDDVLAGRHGGAVLARVFAATLVVIALMSSLVLALAGLAFRARRNLRRAAVPASEDVIDARPVGGHSWVAYGWDRR